MPSPPGDEDDDFILVHHSDVQISEKAEQVYTQLAKILKEQYEVKYFSDCRSRLLFRIFKKIVTAPYLIHGDKIATISWCFFKHPSSLLASCSEKKLESLSDVKQVSKLMNSDVFEFPGRSLHLVLFLLCCKDEHVHRDV